MEVLLGVNENIIGFGEKNSGKEVIENFADLWMLLDVLIVLTH